MKLVCKGEMTLLGRTIHYYEADTGCPDVGICFTGCELVEFLGYAPVGGGGQNTSKYMKFISESRRFKASVHIPGLASNRLCWFVTLSGVVEMLFMRSMPLRDELREAILRDPTALRGVVHAVLCNKI